MNQSRVKGQEWLFNIAAYTHFLNDRSVFSRHKTMRGTEMSVVIGEIKCPELDTRTKDIYFFYKRN